MDKQMELFEDGGLMDEGGMVDEVSGNEVPPGSTREEVRDDIPAQLSEGEFVFPADVVRYFGLETLMKMRQEAKAGLQMMEDMGQMGNSEEATIPDDIPFDVNDLDMEDDGMLEYAQGGVVHAQAGTFVQPQSNIAGFQQSQFAGYQPQYQQYTGQPAPVSQPIQQAYTPVTQQYTPTMPQGQVPTFTGLTGLAAPSPGGYDEMKTYVNDSGMEMQIPFKDGKPIYPIPEGYKLKGEAVQTAQTSTTTGTGVETTQVIPSGDDEGAAPKYSTTDPTGIGYDRAKVKSSALKDVLTQSAISQVRAFGENSLMSTAAKEMGLLATPQTKSAVLGGVLDNFRGGQVSFETGKKSGDYSNVTNLESLTKEQGDIIADVFKSVSQKMEDLYTAQDEVTGKVVNLKPAEVTARVNARAADLGIKTTIGNTNLSKSRQTLEREIAKVEAEKIAAEKTAKEQREETAKTAGEQRLNEAKAMAASLPSGYKIDTEGKSASQIRQEVTEQRNKKREDDTRAERERAIRAAEAARSGGDDGGVQTSEAGQALAEAGGYSVGDSTFGALAKGGLVDQMEKSGLTPKK